MNTNLTTHRKRSSPKPNGIFSAMLAIAAGMNPNNFFMNGERAERQKKTNNLPHQGARECARRIGRDEWRRFKFFDRQRRGLQGAE